MPPQSVFIVVKSGVVASVYGTSKDINIEVVDLDANDDLDQEAANKARDEELQAQMLAGKLHVLN